MRVGFGYELRLNTALNKVIDGALWAFGGAFVLLPIWLVVR